MGYGVLRLDVTSSKRESELLYLVDFQKRLCGIGRSLVSDLEERAKMKSQRILLLSPSVGGTADRFYERLGYSRCNGVFIKNLSFAK